MAKQLVQLNNTSRTEYVFIQNSSSTTGAGLTGLVFNSASLTAYYAVERGAATAITLVTQTPTGAYSSGGFCAVDATNMPGLYRIDIPNAVFATADKSVVMLKGATNMAPVVLEYQIVAFNPDDSVRLGLTALPNAAAGAVGGLPTGNASGQVTVATNNDKTGYSLSGTQTFNVTGNITGNVTGSVGSVSGAVGSVTGAVGSVASGGITAASIATGAIDADALATDAVNEIADGILNRSLATAGSYGNIAITSIVSSVFQAVNTLAVNDKVRFIGTAPTNYVVGTAYYVMSTGLTSTTFQLSSAPGGLSNATPSTGAFTARKLEDRNVLSAMQYLRNKVDVSGSTMTVYTEDDTTTAWTSTITADATAAPITISDPA